MSYKKYAILQPANFKLDGGAMFGIIPRPLWNKVAPEDELGRIDLALRLLMIETKERLIIIDTGIGDYHGEKFDKRFAVTGPHSPLEEALKELGKTADQVTDLIVSHLHFDHVGGIGKLDEQKKFIPVFPKATLHLHRKHYEYAHNPTERDAGSFHSENFDPIIDYYKKHNQLKWHDGEEGNIISLKEGDIKFKCSHGHTPFLMHPYDEKVIYLADLIPTSNHVHIPWVMGYDIAPGQTTKDKRIFLDMMNDKGLTCIFEHDPLFWGSKVSKDEKKNFSCQEKLDAKEVVAYYINP